MLTCFHLRLSIHVLIVTNVGRLPLLGSTSIPNGSLDNDGEFFT